jgi:hypothetical protein
LEKNIPKSINKLPTSTEIVTIIKSKKLDERFKFFQCYKELNNGYIFILFQGMILCFDQKTFKFLEIDDNLKAKIPGNMDYS